MNSFVVRAILVSLNLVLLSLPTQAEISLKELQARIEQQRLTWVAGETSVSGLSPEEKRRLCGFRADKERLPLRFPQIRAPEGGFPPSLDWRSNPSGVNWMTPVRNQGACGSCVAFAAVGALEACENINVYGVPRPSYDLSEQFLFSCGGGDCDNGWYFTGTGGAFEFLMTVGVADEACYPYRSRDGHDYPCENRCSDWATRVVTIPDYIAISAATRPLDDILKTYIQIEPITCVMDVYQSFYSYRLGVYQHIDGEEIVGGHGVVILGWDDTTNPPSWICKNSWGLGWGENGYFKIRRGDSNIGTYAAVLDYGGAPPPPETRSFTPGGIALVALVLLALILLMSQWQVAAGLAKVRKRSQYR